MLALLWSHSLSTRNNAKGPLLEVRAPRAPRHQVWSKIKLHQESTHILLPYCALVFFILFCHDSVFDGKHCWFAVDKRDTMEFCQRVRGVVVPVGPVLALGRDYLDR